MGLRQRTRRRPGDDGFTLVEVLLAVTIMGTVVAALAMALVVSLRSTGAATSRMTDSQAAQSLAKWFAADVQQADPGDAGADLGTRGSGCSVAAGADEGTNVVTFVTTLSTSPAKTAFTSYRLVGTGADRRLVRYWCEGGKAPVTLVLAEGLQDSAAPPVSVTRSGTQVSLAVYQASGYKYVTLGQRVLDGVTPACTASLSVDPPTALELTPAGSLPSAVKVTASLTGFCPSAVSLSISPAPAGYTGPLTFPGNGTSRQVELAGQGYTWSAGTSTLGLVGVSGVSAQLQLVAPAPCAATLAPLSDPSLTLTAANQLPKDVVLSMTTNGSTTCPPGYVVSYGSGQVAVTTSGTSGTATLPKHTGSWSAGTVTFTLKDTAQTTSFLPTRSLVLQGAAPVAECSAGLAVSPSTVALASGGKLAQDLVVTATDVADACPNALSVRFSSSAESSPRVDLSLKQNKGWTDTASRSDGSWAVGTVTVTLSHGNRDLATATVAVTAGQSNCKLVNTQPNAGPQQPPADKNTGKTKQEIRIVMQPTTNDNTPCRGLAARFTTSSGQVLSFLVVTEGQNVTAKIPSGTGPFVAGQKVNVQIVDTWAADALVGTSWFQTFAQ